MHKTIAALAAVLAFGFWVDTALALPIPVPAPESPAGSPIVTPPSSSSSSPTNITVNVTPPPPDPAATQAMYDHFIANAELDHASVPVTVANGLLKSDNIWTNTPWSMIDIDSAHKLRLVARNVALALFTLGVVWSGSQLAFGQLTGTTTYQQVLPIMIVGFFIAMYSETIAHKSVDLCNWLNGQFGNATLPGFSGTALTLPEKPQPATTPGIIGVPAAFFSGLLTTLVYAIVLLILELKLIFRDAILILMTTVMPVSGVLWAFDISRSYGSTLYRLFFGWLFGQPLVVICLNIASGLFTFFNDVDGPALVFVKLAVLLLSIKALTIFVGGGLGSGGFFGFASILMLLRRMHHARGAANATGTPATSNAAALQGMGPTSHTTGGGTAATGRPWRPAPGFD